MRRLFKIYKTTYPAQKVKKLESGLSDKNMQILILFTRFKSLIIPADLHVIMSKPRHNLCPFMFFFLQKYQFLFFLNKGQNSNGVFVVTGK